MAQEQDEDLVRVKIKLQNDRKFKDRLEWIKNYILKGQTKTWPQNFDPKIDSPVDHMIIAPGYSTRSGRTICFASILDFGRFSV